jgi:hypothetical protein
MSAVIDRGFHIDRTATPSGRFETNTAARRVDRTARPAHAEDDHSGYYPAGADEIAEPEPVSHPQSPYGPPRDGRSRQHQEVNAPMMKAKPFCATSRFGYQLMSNRAEQRPAPKPMTTPMVRLESRDSQA